LKRLTRDEPSTPCVLVVDDDASMAEMLAEGLSDRGFDAKGVASSSEAARLLAEEHFDALVTDLRMPTLDGLGLLVVSRRLAPTRPVIIITAYSAVDTAVESIRQGAYHYLTKPFKVEELVLFLRRGLEDITVELPPLRQRREDIPLLLSHFLTQSRGRHPNSPVYRIGPEAAAKLATHRWPGNVRELEHVVERLVVLGRSAEVVPSDLPNKVGLSDEGPVQFEGEVLPIRELQRRYAQGAYEKLGGRKLLTAEALGVDYKTLSRWLDAPEREERDAGAG
jgi:DNA-binding NtrC family response regulator